MSADNSLKEHNKEVYYVTNRIVKLNKSDIRLIKNMIKISRKTIDIYL